MIILRTALKGNCWAMSIPAQVRKRVDMGKWFKFTKPGRYQITGLYELEFYGRDDHRKVVWEDFAVGSCLVHIVDARAKAPAKQQSEKK